MLITAISYIVKKKQCFLGVDNLVFSDPNKRVKIYSIK